ncbi:hypothetical protein ACH49_08395 [Streptomyces leeuwenhoekii]|uniref:Uncharacterized protein n=1 Tax=Streptomyces leeuwenhoekii TaxID=1437453 RepID=A0ABR5I1W6_STRLW|nr:hypothetical protein [Streptomyces leeuwenhoekii]KMS80288.1 hypothetical protein ACH49_08395 [Streptomyces leeuwenhoekii]
MTSGPGTEMLPAPRTAPGRGTVQPEGTYEPPPAVGAPDDSAIVVHFTGKDHRTAVFSFEGLPLPELHEDLARAFAARFGKNQLNTVASTYGQWTVIQRLLRFLGSLPRPPRSMSRLTGAQLKRYRMHVQAGMTERSLFEHFKLVQSLLRKIPADELRPEVLDAIWQVERVDQRRARGKPGYDDATFHKIVTAARSSVVDIYQRIREGERLLARFESDPTQLMGEELDRGAELAEIARTGLIPHIPQINENWRSANLPNTAARLQTARQLFLTHDDMVPLVVFGVAVTGRNGETIKELPVEHRLLDGQAVALEIVKRRRGADRWFEEVTWDVGRPSDRLKTAGGYYLFCERLTRRGRQFSRSPLIWSVWTNGKMNGKDATGGHKNPFDARLNLTSTLTSWVKTRPELRDLSDFSLDLNRLKTTLDRINTRAAGGHLPSSTRSNTQDVLFRNYLAGDPDVQDWAEDVITEALEDAEDAARTAYRQARKATGELKVVTGSLDEARRDADAAGASVGLDADTAREVLDGERDTAFAACTKTIDDCRDSFLTCFACRNAVATASHLPAQLALLDELADLWEGTDRDTWWRRFGQAWLAINEDILPRFTPQERAAAEAAKPADRVLPLLEGPSEEDITWV